MSDNPAKKWAGKYENPDELEKGYSELMREIARVKEQGVQVAARADALDRYNKQLEGAITQIQANPGQGRNTPRPLVDEDGRLDEAALENAINSRLKPLQDQLASVPRVIQETLGGLLGPVQKQVAASSAFWAREDVEKSKFSQAEMRRFLDGNDPIRGVYETILANPETAEKAYDYAFSVWASTRPKAHSKIDEGRKLSAGQPTPSAGPTAQSPEEEGSWKRIQSLEAQASFTRDPGVIQAALGERFKGSKIMEDLNRYAEEKGYQP
jgi:hypothetical protein